MKTLSLTETRNQLLRLAEEIERDPSVVVQVEKRGKKVMAMMSADLYEALLETLDLARDPDAVGALRKALREIEKGKAIPWSVVRGRLESGE